MAASDTKSAERVLNISADRKQARERAAEYLLRRHRFKPAEALPWLVAIAVFFIFPDRMTFGSQVVIMVMFALSLDLILGYAGIVTLGHAAFFGIGAYTVGLGAARLGWTEPISGLFAAAIVSALGRLHLRLVPAALSRPHAADADAGDRDHVAGGRQSALGFFRRL